MFTLLLSVILVTVPIFIWYYKRVYLLNRHLKNYASPPGGYPFLGLTFQFLDPKGLLAVLLDWIPKYGETVRADVGSVTHLFTVEYKLIEWVLSQNKHLKKSKAYFFITKWLGTGLLTNDGGPKWKKHRKILTPAFHFKILEDYVDVFQSVGKKLIRRLEKEVGKKSIDISHFTTLYALDVICETAMGTSVNALEDENSSYVKNVKEMLRIVIDRTFSAPKNLEFIYYFTKDYRKEIEALKVLHGYTNAVIASKLEKLEQSTDDNKKEIDDFGVKKRKSFLDILLSEMKNSSLSLQDIRQEVDTFMFAGHDTTSSGLSFLIYSLATHPDIQDKVYQEQYEIFKDDTERTITGNDLREMNYLELVIKESMRLYPPVPLIGREISDDVIMPDGRILPKGIFIGVFIYGANRNPKYFPEPDKFIPERFLNIDGSYPYAYIPFSSGPRNCIGQKFAMNELKTVASEIVRTFRILPADPLQPVELKSEVVLSSKNGVHIQLQKR